MKKIELVLQPDQFTSFTSYYLEEYWRRYFDISVYAPAKTYDKSGTIFVFWWMNADGELPIQLKDCGYRVAVDHLWEYPTHRTDFYWIEHVDWFRFNESLWWRALGYHQYRPNKTLSKRAFMPMNQRRDFRDSLYNTMKPLLDDCIWSYMDKILPGDADREQFPEWQRFLNPSWYDSTYCSIVAESTMKEIWTTEKSFKPIGFYHPFLVLSAPAHLEKIKSLGFATFDNIFDESYDSTFDLEKRCQQIYDNISSIKLSDYDTETQKRLEHNHDHFFNQPLVESIIEKEIVEPLIEYAET